GAVYKARQPMLDRYVALKILPPEAASGPGFTERFTREARALARLNHPNIVAVHEFGQSSSPSLPLEERAGLSTVASAKVEERRRSAAYHYLIMEFVDGANLREMERAQRLLPAQALSIVPKICEALQYAHDEGVVHRDIKPENILVDKKGRVKIADFGIAKILGAEQSQAPLTGVIGTPHYMSPEQIEKPQTVDHRADIYSLGVVFYEMLTGELPLGRFAAPSKKVQIDVRLDEIVLRALEKEPEQRYQHASQVKSEVETIAHTPPTPPVLAQDNGWQPAICVVAILLSAIGLVCGTVMPPPVNWALYIFGAYGVGIGGVKLAGLWPFSSPVFPRSNFTRRNLGKNDSEFKVVRLLIVLGGLVWLPVAFGVARQNSGAAIPLVLLFTAAYVAASIFAARRYVESAVPSGSALSKNSPSATTTQRSLLRSWPRISLTFAAAVCFLNFILPHSWNFDAGVRIGFTQPWLFWLKHEVGDFPGRHWVFNPNSSAFYSGIAFVFIALLLFLLRSRQKRNSRIRE
ncbi:MAG: protein kinase domain-containing protein, partial [Limisphaerales bacterium]